VLLIAAAILAARKLASCDPEKGVPATICAIADAVRWAAAILNEIDRRFPTRKPNLISVYGATEVFGELVLFVVFLTALCDLGRDANAKVAGAVGPAGAFGLRTGHRFPSSSLMPFCKAETGVIAFPRDSLTVPPLRFRRYRVRPCRES
jgi:hypothetical protein